MPTRSHVVRARSRSARCARTCCAICSHVVTITCQYAHYFKGRDKEVNAGTGTLPAGNPDDKDEPADDCKLTFDVANGTVKAIHIVMNRHLDNPALRDEVIGAAMRKQFP